MKLENRKKIEEAGRSAVTFKEKGFHCSESVFMAINETLKITDPSMVRIVTGFHGGGGTHRTEPGVDMNVVLAEIAAGTDQRPDDEIPLEQVGHLCGAVAVPRNARVHPVSLVVEARARRSDRLGTLTPPACIPTRREAAHWLNRQSLHTRTFARTDCGCHEA